mgnify:CR=1 FL=1|jgi:nucleoid-associated protein EbfC
MNMQKMMQQAQQMQANMERVQKELEEKEVEAASGGGAVKVVATGGKKIKEIKISAQAVDEDDIEMLEDLVLAAVNEAITKADELASAEMAKVTGGMGLGNML